MRCRLRCGRTPAARRPDVGYVKGLRELEQALDGLAARIDAAGAAIVRDGAALVERAAKKNFEGAHPRGAPHVGGDKPNVVTGTLRRSITSDPIRRTGLGTYSTKVGPRTVYGRRVELGYSGGSGRGRQATRPFPYFTPAVREVSPRLRSIAAAHWAAAVTKG